MVDLYKFVKGEYLESFLKGDLYMSSLGYFWMSGFEGQMDFFEGICKAQNPAASQIQEPVRSAIKGSILYRQDSYQYCNLLCFYKHKYDLKRRETTIFEPEMMAFGDYAVRILDPQILVTRLQMHAEKRDDYFLAGSVHYQRRDVVSEYMDCFDKMQQYAGQKEWRIAYLNNFKEKQSIVDNNPTTIYKESLIIKIGDLRSITKVYKVEDLVASPLNVYRGFKIVDQINSEDSNQFNSLGLPHEKPWYADAYYGWSDRGTFQNKVMELDGGKSRIMFSV